MTFFRRSIRWAAATALLTACGSSTPTTLGPGMQSSTGASGSASTAGGASDGGTFACGTLTCASSEVCCLVDNGGANVLGCVAPSSCATPIGASASTSTGGTSTGVSSTATTSTSASSSSTGSTGAPGTGSVPCGGVGTCKSPNVCCAGGAQNGGNTCVTADACDQAGGDIYTCGGKANCPSNAVCCVLFGAAPSGGDLAQCLGACPIGTEQVCQTVSDCSTGQSCAMGDAVFDTCQ